METINELFTINPTSNATTSKILLEDVLFVQLPALFNLNQTALDEAVSFIPFIVVAISTFFSSFKLLMNLNFWVISHIVRQNRVAYQIEVSALGKNLQ